MTENPNSDARKRKKAAPRRPGVASTPAAAPSILASAALMVLLAALIAALEVYRAGWAASWHALALIGLQSLPLGPAFALVFWCTRWLRRRYSASLLVLIPLLILASFAAMMLTPAATYSIYHRSFVGSGDEFDVDYTLWQTLFAIAAGFYIYLSTAARLWLPLGALVPLVATYLGVRIART